MRHKENQTSQQKHIHTYAHMRTYTPTHKRAHTYIHTKRSTGVQKESNRNSLWLFDNVMNTFTVTWICIVINNRYANILWQLQIVNILSAASVSENPLISEKVFKHEPFFSSRGSFWGHYSFSLVLESFN